MLKHEAFTTLSLTPKIHNIMLDLLPFVKTGLEDTGMREHGYMIPAFPVQLTQSPSTVFISTYHTIKYQLLNANKTKS